MPIKKRANTHQTHFEDLVLLGPDGLEELNDKIEGTIDTLENNSERLNLTTKIDGAPAMICWSSYPGYPDNSIALKGFISGPQNAISSPDQVDAKYGDRPGMSQMLKYGLELSKHIPAGEAWQGDCLFVGNTKREEEINGKDYITFQPNKIIYAFSEDNPGYEKVKNADFGIAFHTIYTGEDKKQSFKVDASKLNVPSNIYIMSPSLNKPTDKKVFNLDKVKSQFDKLQSLEQKLLSNFDYEDLIDNRIFMNYWNTFENANLADKKAVTINENTFINDLKEYIKTKRTKEYETQVGKLKTDTGKEKAKTKYEQDLVDLQELVETNKELLTTLVQTLNCAATIKMLLWQGFKQTQFDYNTFYRSRTKGYIPGEMEGVAMSDQDGNIVKIVDRSTFSSYNRDPDIISGFDHPENLTEEQVSFAEEYNNELSECDPKQLWERFGKLLESGQKTAVVAFGRMNPPTIGHQKLVDKMASLAQGEKAKLFLSHTQDKKKNPLSYEQKLRYAKEAFEPKIDVVESADKTIIDVLSNLYNQGYTDIIYVGGEDRIGGAEDISSLILRYNGQPTKDGKIIYNFNSIDFKSAGARNDNSDDLSEKASASLARQYAQDGDFEHFKEIAATDAENMYHDVRAGLGILNEEILTEEPEGTGVLTKAQYLKPGVKQELDQKLNEIGLEMPKDINKTINDYRRDMSDYVGIFSKNDGTLNYSYSDIDKLAKDSPRIPNNAADLLNNDIYVTLDNGKKKALHRSGIGAFGSAKFTGATTTSYQEAIMILLLANKIPEAHESNFKEWLYDSNPDKNTGIFKYINRRDGLPIEDFNSAWRNFVDLWYNLFEICINNSQRFNNLIKAETGHDVSEATVIHSDIKNTTESMKKALSGADLFDKSDAYLCFGNVSEILGKMKELRNNPSDYVKFMIDNKSDIIGISLKKSKSPDLHIEYDIPSKDDDFFTGEVKWTSAPSTQTLYFYTPKKTQKLYIRSNKAGSPGTAEFAEEGALSQIGKATTAIKYYLKDSKFSEYLRARKFREAATELMKALCDGAQEPGVYMMTPEGKKLITNIYNLAGGFAATNDKGERISAPYIKVY